MRVTNNQNLAARSSGVREAMLVVLQLLESPSLIRKIAGKMSPEGLQLLIESVDQQNNPGKDEIRVAVSRFLGRVSEKKIENNNSTRLRKILQQVDRASENVSAAKRAPFTWLRSQRAEDVAALLKRETETTIALVVTHLGELGNRVLELLPDLAPSILTRISNLDRPQVNRNVAEAIEVSLRRRLQSGNSVEKSHRDLRRSEFVSEESCQSETSPLATSWKRADQPEEMLIKELN